MKHAYLIIAHNDYPVLEALLSMLDDERNDIYLYIDKRSHPLRRQAEAFQTKRAGFYIIKNPIKLYWGDVSLVKAEFALMETAIANGDYAYFHLLSGADLAIKSQDYIHSFFQKNAGKEFVNFWQGPEQQRDLERKIFRYYIFTKSMKRSNNKWHAITAPCHNLLLITQKLIHFRRKCEVDFKKGSQWFSITKDFCQYLIKQKEFVLKRFKYTLCPDEIFVQTILWNSPFKANIYSLDEDHGNMRLIDWKRGAPYNWQEEDFEEISHSDELFARKFSSDQQELINRIVATYSKQKER